MATCTASFRTSRGQLAERNRYALRCRRAPEARKNLSPRRKPWEGRKCDWERRRRETSLSTRLVSPLRGSIEPWPLTHGLRRGLGFFRACGALRNGIAFATFAVPYERFASHDWRLNAVLALIDYGTTSGSLPAVGRAESCTWYECLSEAWTRRSD